MRFTLGKGYEMEQEIPDEIPDWVVIELKPYGQPLHKEVLLSVPEDVSLWVHRNIDQLSYEAYRWCQTRGLLRAVKVECSLSWNTSWTHAGDWDISTGSQLSSYELCLEVPGTPAGMLLAGKKLVGINTKTEQWFESDYDVLGYGLRPAVLDYTRAYDGTCVCRVYRAHEEDELQWLPGRDVSGVVLVYDLEQILRAINTAVDNMPESGQPQPRDASSGVTLQSHTYYGVTDTLRCDFVTVVQRGKYPYRVQADGDNWVIRYGCMAWFILARTQAYPDEATAIIAARAIFAFDSVLYSSSAEAQAASETQLMDRFRNLTYPDDLRIIWNENPRLHPSTELADVTDPAPRARYWFNGDELRNIVLSGWEPTLTKVRELLDKTQAEYSRTYHEQQAKLLSLQRRQMTLTRQRRRLF